MKKRKKVFIADDHAIIRDGLRHILSRAPEYEIIGEAGDGREAIEKIEELEPDIVLLDISMPFLTGVEVARHIKQKAPSIKIIILSQYDNFEYIKELLEIGVDGYVLKDDTSDELLRAVSEVLKGNNFLSPDITRIFISDYSGSGKTGKEGELETQFNLLTPREREILKLIADGRQNAAIASILFISEHTVKTHRSNIMKKLDIHNLVDLIKYAMKNGLIES